MEIQRPKIAIIDPNTLAVLGLKAILESAMPMVQIETFGSLDALEAKDVDTFFHYFVATNVVLSNRQFFVSRRQKTIVLTTSKDPNSQLSDFHCICINQNEERLIKSLLALEQSAHANGRNLPPVPKAQEMKVLSDREIEVLSLIVEGNINKEIADRLNIGLSTVITHRKNIMDKLGLKSVSALTIYAVMHGYVDVNKI